MDTVKAHGAEQATDGWKPITAGVASTPLVRYGAKLVLQRVLLKIFPVSVTLSSISPYTAVPYQLHSSVAVPPLAVGT